MFKLLKKLVNKTSILIFIVLMILCLFFFWGWFQKQYFKCVGMYDIYKGDKAFKHGDLQKAITLYNRGVSLYPEHYQAWYNLGNIYVVYEDYYAAVDAYEHSIKHNRHFTLARMNLGIVSSEKTGNFDGAINQYQAIINSRKMLWFIPFVFRNTKSERINRGLAHYNMGVAYRQKSLYQCGDDKLRSTANLRKAVAAYINATKILKKDYDTRYNLAIAYHLLGDYKNAGKNYCKAIDLKPMNYEAHYNISILLRHLKMYQDAYHEIEKATILVSNDSRDSNSNVSSYVFDVLNEISKTLVLTDEYKNLRIQLDDEAQEGYRVTYVGGKIVATDALDKAMLKNFKTCAAASYWEDDN